MARKKILENLVTFVSLFLLGIGANAQSTRITNSIHHQTQSIRALGMGGAILATADDYNTLAFNPAGLAFLKEWQMHGTLAAGIDKDILTLISDISDAQNLGNSTDQTNAIIEVIEKQFGKTPNLRITPLSGTWVWPGMGFAFTPIDLSTDMSINQQLGPSITFSSMADSTFRLGYGREIKLNKGKLSWGIGAKAIYRAFYQNTLSAVQLAEGSDDLFTASDADEGFTVDADIGVIYIPEIPTSGMFQFLKYIQPSVGLVVRNVLDLGFKTNFNLLDENSSEPPKLGRVFDIGTKFELPELWVFHPRFVFDVQDIGDTNWTFKKGYHAGFELEWVVASWLRGAYRVGLNQGYVTMGVTAKLAAFELDLASWGEEIGVSGNAKESRRYLVNLSLDF